MRKFLKMATAFLLVFAFCLTSQAATIEGLEGEKDDLKDKKKEAQSVVDQLQSEQNAILAVVEELDNRVAECSAQIVDLENRKVELQAEIEETKISLAEAEVEEQKQYEAMKLHIQYAYENGEVSFLDTLFTSAKMSEVINQTEYAEQIYNYDARMLNDLIDIRQSIQDDKKKLEEDLASVEEIELEVQDNRDAIQIMIDGKKAQIENYEDSIELQEKYIAEIEADIAALDNQIAALEAEFRRQQEAAAAAAAAQAAAGQQVTVTEIHYTGGKLQWPVSSGGYVSSPYGPRQMFGRSFHYGLDIACKDNTPIVACEAGQVLQAGYQASMGNYVVIAHGDGLTTTYMHNNSVAVSAGQMVSRGQVIAYAGSTGDSTGTHCHLAVRLNGVYQDPAAYVY